MNQMNNELYHFGVKGMKWGVRRNRSTTTPNGKTNSRQSFKENRIAKKEAKQKAKNLKKAQKDWDKNYEKNYMKAYNNAADIANKKLIPEINKKYANVDFSNLNDPKVKAAHEKYINEYEEQFNSVFQKQYDEIVGKRPE